MKHAEQFIFGAVTITSIVLICKLIALAIK